MPDSKQLEKFYNKFGKKQEKQFYENAPLSALIAHSDFENAHGIYEFGCGTGKFARLLFERHLNSQCHYTGIDISATMVELCKNQLDVYSQRARCIKGNFLSAVDIPEFIIDRFVAAYVLDLLSEEDADEVLNRAYDMLQPGGYLCIAALSHGTGLLSKLVEKTWNALYSLRPMLVGGCRPVCISEKLLGQKWQKIYSATIVSFGVPSEVLVAKKMF